MNNTFISICSGSGLADVGLMQAGLVPIGAVEIEPAIAESYRANIGPHILVQDVCAVDWRHFDKPGGIWASPSCKNASNANVGATETQGDRDVAAAIARAVECHRPDWFILENVEGYKNFKSFHSIIAALDRLGYWHGWQVINSADLGVPQTRRRLILRALKPEHVTGGAAGLFGGGRLPDISHAVAWRGWYQAVEDLVPSLPDSEFAPWQLERLEKMNLSETVLMTITNTTREATVGQSPQPAPTIINGMGRRPSALPLAFIVPGGNTKSSSFLRGNDDDPVSTVTSHASRSARAFIMEGTAGGKNSTVMPPVREDGTPVFTVRAGTNMPRAFIVDGQQTNPGKNPTDRSARTLITRDSENRIFTIPASVAKGLPTALLIGQDSKLTIREQERPSQSVTASDHNGYLRAWLSQDRVVKMTPRALARFQSVPDWYQLPAKDSLACTIVGNGVPCLMAEMIARLTLGL